jgi:hypothetical protein
MRAPLREVLFPLFFFLFSSPRSHHRPLLIIIISLGVRALSRAISSFRPRVYPRILSSRSSLLESPLRFPSGSQFHSRPSKKKKKKSGSSIYITILETTDRRPATLRAEIWKI